MNATLSSRSHFRKAEATLAAARLLLETGQNKGASARAYAAMSDAARGALYALGEAGEAPPVQPHGGLLAEFARHCVETGELGPEFGRDLNRVRSLGTLTEESGEPVTPEKAAWAVERASAFLKAVRTRFSA